MVLFPYKPEGLGARGASSIIQSESEGPRTRSANVWRQKKMDISAQEERENLPFLSFLALFEALFDWMMPSCTGSPLTQMLISSRNPLTDTSRHVILASKASLSPVKLTHKISHHTWFL